MIWSQFSSCLITWYQKNKRDLPWRKTRDPYAIWISEVMLQQTTVGAVIPYYQRWMKKFPDIRCLSRARPQTVLALWQGLGYYQRARNIKKTAEILVRESCGQIPSTYQELRQLPGFGPYTTGAVLSLAFHKRIPIVDANVRRVMMRILAIKGKTGVLHDEKIYHRLQGLLPKSKKMNAFNQGLMELGALICRNREPLCGLCPVRSFCQGYQQGIQEIIPEPRKKILKRIHAAIAIIEKNKKFLIHQRPEKGLLAGLWEFPGGKLNRGETVINALKREMKEEIGVDIICAQKYLELKHFYTQFCVYLHVYRCRIKNSIFNRQEYRWVSLKNIGRYPMPSGSVKIIEQIRKDRNAYTFNK